MRLNVTAPPARTAPELDLRSAGELAPELALPWVIRLRYGLALGQVATILFVVLVLKLAIPLVYLAIPIAITALSNLILSRRDPAAANPPRLFLAIFVLDTLSLTAMLALTGGASNPFSLLYLVQITISAVVLGRASTFALGILSTLCFGALFRIYRPLAELNPEHQHGGSLHLTGMWVAFGIAALLICYFVSHVAEALRKREREVIAYQDRLARHEKFASLVTLAAGAAHELNTPLATIAVVSKELEHAARGNESMADDARLIRAEVERCRVILQRLSVRGAEPVGETPLPTEVHDVVQQAVRQLSPERQALLRVTLADKQHERVLPPDALACALAALLNNAFDADSQGRVSIEVSTAADRLRFTVRDRGPGMSPEILRRVAEPFFTTKEPGAGMGLGVFLVRMFAERMEGELVYESELGSGTSVTLELPAPAIPVERHATV